MATLESEIAAQERAATQERARLVRLCARLTGDPGAAEDLAQETLAEAWRWRDKLRDESARPPWLVAIARNVCLRWAQRQRRDHALLPLIDHGCDDGSLDSWPWLADPDDPTVELERHELADLLDRALALLPPVTAQVLIERYIRESPHAEIAGRLGISPDAVAMRLNRGKLHLRKLLTSELRHEAAAYHPGDPLAAGWQETRIWCTECGRRRLLGRFERPGGLLAFRCPGCRPSPDHLSSAFRLGNPHFARLLAGISSYKPAYARALAWVHDYYRGGLAAGTVACTNCGHAIRLVHERASCPDMTSDPWPRFVARCPACGELGSTSLGGLVQAHPAIRRFWRAHPRMRLFPPREVERDGVPALVSRAESVTGGAYLEILSARDTYAVIALHGDTGSDRPEAARA